MTMEGNTVGFQHENSHLAATDVLKAIAAGEEIHLVRCRISGALDLNMLL